GRGHGYVPWDLNVVADTIKEML
ncbi:hypothetical protein A2U01_0112680, partial [Trifolium medium]|nr:hypothetical protein [Trifolium medium]